MGRIEKVGRMGRVGRMGKEKCKPSNPELRTPYSPFVSLCCDRLLTRYIGYQSVVKWSALVL
jgi:hypothetical protein